MFVRMKYTLINDPDIRYS